MMWTQLLICSAGGEAGRVADSGCVKHISNGQMLQLLMLPLLQIPTCQGLEWHITIKNAEGCVNMQLTQWSETRVF